MKNMLLIKFGWKLGVKIFTTAQMRDIIVLSMPQLACQCKTALARNGWCLAVRHLSAKILSAHRVSMLNDHFYMEIPTNL